MRFFKLSSSESWSGTVFHGGADVKQLDPYPAPGSSTGTPAVSFRFFRVSQDAAAVANRARESGYTIGPVYHGSANTGVNVFDPGKAGSIQTSDWGRGIYWTPSHWMADSYRIGAVTGTDDEANRLYDEMEGRAKEMGTTGMMKWIDLRGNKITQEQYDELYQMENQWREALEKAENSEKGQVYAAFLKIQKPYVYRYVGITDPYLAALARERGCDAVVVTSEEADTSGPIESWAEEILVFSPNQIKSADPVTYDDQGNPIPLEKRFDPSIPDIRY